eukprot:CAMPEP_0170536766 /NCGR_PEP_ID=MMETSP0209-20121228/102332_1 /TAXON_ID=665100 ORGANISM="Litonotus pictus, Strain P1" /NCGR_SAMPLE_ID=MMETSP0209 /ASSEMBLY_ACC=CAM_ASM_000301 /LENGTH=417 /DNA_ID=CAMNT_0010838167 /DNA_START=170 /DNA_END=1423 /DNA_ORIENTATION=+
MKSTFFTEAAKDSVKSAEEFKLFLVNNLFQSNSLQSREIENINQLVIPEEDWSESRKFTVLKQKILERNYFTLVNNLYVSNEVKALNKKLKAESLKEESKEENEKGCFREGLSFEDWLGKKKESQKQNEVHKQKKVEAEESSGRLNKEKGSTQKVPSIAEKTKESKASMIKSSQEGSGKKKEEKTVSSEEVEHRKDDDIFSSITNSEVDLSSSVTMSKTNNNNTFKPPTKTVKKTEVDDLSGLIEVDDSNSKQTAVEATKYETIISNDKTNNSDNTNKVKELTIKQDKQQPNQSNQVNPNKETKLADSQNSLPKPKPENTMTTNKAQKSELSRENKALFQNLLNLDDEEDDDMDLKEVLNRRTQVTSNNNNTSTITQKKELVQSKNHPQTKVDSQPPVVKKNSLNKKVWEFDEEEED